MDRRTSRRRERHGAARAIGRLACALAIALGAAPARPQEADTPDAPTIERAWRTRSVTLAFLDDFLAPKSTLRDDDGFSAALGIAVEIPDGRRSLLRVGATDQLITERGGLDRVDDGRVYASGVRRFGESAARGTTVGWLLGVQVVGNLGGSRLQDWAHRAVFTGRRLDAVGARRLQFRYVPGYAVLADVGGSATMSQPLRGPWSVRGGAEGLLGIGTGWLGELRPFVAVAYTTDRVEVEFRQGAGIYGTNIRPLTLRGGYVTGVLQSQPALRVAVRGPGATTLTFGLEWNQGNSQQHVGGISIATRF
jgi:hypothetical protein